LICPGFCPGRDVHAMHWATMRENQQRRQERREHQARRERNAQNLRSLAEEPDAGAADAALMGQQHDMSV